MQSTSIAPGAKQGSFVALSADGNTAIVGGRSGFAGTPGEGAWVWTRNGGAWTQQGPELIGSGLVPGNPVALQGNPVAISADGNTVLVGAPNDNGDTGAAWIWMRSGGVWTQQGSKLTATDAVGATFLGRSVALSAGGYTAVIGGNGDDNSLGATWIWTKTETGWLQQGSKLIGSAAAGASQQGNSVAISGDASTLMSGGNGTFGPVWVWTRTGSGWMQQGEKLVGEGGAGTRAWQGYAVAIAGDGNTAIVGAVFEGFGIGAAWVWIRRAGQWIQQAKLVGSNAVESPAGFYAHQGSAVAISADGNTAIVGGATESTGRDRVGAAWVFTRAGAMWTEQQKLVATDSVGTSFQGQSVALSADGNTALIGGSGDDNGIGAAWVWTRNEDVWIEGPKLIGTGVTHCSRNDCPVGASQGGAVALSADGRTAIVGGVWDDPTPASPGFFQLTGGAAWVWKRTGSLWTQQAKLVGSRDFPSGTSAGAQGGSVALSADGNTAVVGAAAGFGAAWVWTRSADTWIEKAKLFQESVFQQGKSVSLSYDGSVAVVGGVGSSWIWKLSGATWTHDENALIGSAEVGFSFQGAAASLSGDGNTVIIGGPYDNDDVGAAWIFARPGPPRRRAVSH